MRGFVIRDLEDPQGPSYQKTHLEDLPGSPYLVRDIEDPQGAPLEDFQGLISGGGCSGVGFLGIDLEDTPRSPQLERDHEIPQMSLIGGFL